MMIGGISSMNLLSKQKEDFRQDCVEATRTNSGKTDLKEVFGY